MMRSLAAYTAATLCLCSGVRAQPITCQSDDQCQGGFYCVQDAFVCGRCLNCEELKRDPSRDSSSCIKSIADCGSCIKGFVEDLRGDVSAQCVLPDARNDSQPAYVWVAVAVGLTLFVLILVAIVVYSLRNINTLKIMASTRASVQSQCVGGGGAGASGPGSAGPVGVARGPGAASAPELPPAYDAHYNARPTSPDPLLESNAEQEEESSWPFIKIAPSPVVRQQRVTVRGQAARVFHNPDYVRAPVLPPAAHAPPAYSIAEEEEGEELTAISSEERDAFTHDEDTMESPWTPTTISDNGAAAADVTGAPPAPAPAPVLTVRGALCTRQDTDNTRNAGDPLGPGEGPTTGPSNVGPSFIINVLQNINAVQHQSNSY